MGFLLFLFYNTLIPFFIIISFPLVIVIRTKSFTFKYWIKRIFPEIKAFKNKTVLFHCSSIGEINAIKSIIEFFKNSFPNYTIVITTFTETALLAAKQITENAFIIPFDFYPVIKKFVKKVNPDFIFIAETELWPSFVKVCSERSKLYYINAKISENSFTLYKIISPLLKYSFKKALKIFVQNEESAKRFSHFIDKEKIYVSGNTKYDVYVKTSDADDIKFLLSKIGFDKKKLITFGSIHLEELDIILKSYDLIYDKENIKYIIVPRHVEKTRFFEEKIKKIGLKYLKFSDIGESNEEKINLFDTQILIVDKIGVLLKFYFLSCICFVGGTLNKIGGHNLLEPSIFSKPVLFGPNYFNQKEAAQRLIEYKGGFVVKDEYDLKSRIEVLLSEKYLITASLNSNKALLSLKGATDKIIKEIFKI
ncbi:MAG: hypothetical protein K6357_04455 [Elusimicrobiota bacterium]